MKRSLLTRAAVMLAALAVGFVAPPLVAQPLTTSFTYQGSLKNGSALASGSYDIRFKLFDALSGGVQVGPTLCKQHIAVNNGTFSVSLDFGMNFAGQQRFLQIEVRPDTGAACPAPNDPANFTLLSPRQTIEAAPASQYAITAGSASTAGTSAALNGQPASFYLNAANLTGTLGDSRLSGNVAKLNASQTFTGATIFTNINNAFTGTFTGNGAAITNLSGQNITPASISRTSMDLPLQAQIPSEMPPWWLPERFRNIALPGTWGYDAGLGMIGQYAFLLRTFDGTLFVIDTAQSFGPQIIAQVPVNIEPGQSTWNMAVVGGYAYITTRFPAELKVYSLADPAAPAYVGEIPLPADPATPNSFITGDGNRLGVPNGLHLDLYSLDNPAAPVLIGSFPNHMGELRIMQGKACVFDDAPPGSVRIYDVSGGASPVLISTIVLEDTTLVGEARINGNLLYFACRDTSSPSPLLRIYDLSNLPATPQVGQAVLPSSFSLGFRPSIQLPYAFIGGVGPSQSCVVDVSVPAQPRVLGIYPGTENENILSGPHISGGIPNELVTDPGSGQVYFRSYLPGSGSYFPASRGLFAGSMLVGTITPPSTTGLSVGGVGQFSGAVTASGFSGDGSALANLNAANILSGQLNPARLPSSVVRTDIANAFGNSPNTFAGNVGIGTTNPRKTMHVHQDNLALANSAIWSSESVVVAANDANLNLYSANVGNYGSHIQLKEVDGVGALINNWCFTRRTSNNGSALEWRFGTSPDGNAGSLMMALSTSGNLSVTGSLSKGGGSFKIDHPLDPQNKYLYHSFVESPDMMNIYNGVVTTDAAGYATITLPDYFEALNSDYRYQLTVIDEADDTDIFLWAKVVKKVKDREFTIRTARGNVEVSWQVTGIRKDAWAQKNRIPTSVDKVGQDKGTYLHPEAFGAPARGGPSDQPSPSR